MARAASCGGALLILLAMSATGQASDQLLASYEPTEFGLIVGHGATDPGLTVTWPLQGGVDGVPAATDGSYVLKLEWTNETDRKVAFGHFWSGFTFDLPGIVAGVAELKVDVCVPEGGAVPGTVGVWDDVLGWIEGWTAPAETAPWVTISMYVGDLRNVGHDPYSGLNHIWALILQELASDEGVIYVDNLRLSPARELSFAGYTWLVKHAAHVGPGNNYYSTDMAWTDTDGLHLKIAQSDDGRWLCGEVVGDFDLGYGTYVFRLESRIDGLARGMIVGAYTWDTYAKLNEPGQDREMDIELGTWWDFPGKNALYAIQPSKNEGNEHRFEIQYDGCPGRTTHAFTWRDDGVCFASYLGDICVDPPPGTLVGRWAYTKDYPRPWGGNIRLNFWLDKGIPPSSGQGAEVVFSDFRYFPFDSEPKSDTDCDDWADDWADGSDNLPLIYNPGQDDTDGDGFADTADNCPTERNPHQGDCDQDGIGNRCDFAPCDMNCDCAVDFDDIPGFVRALIGKDPYDVRYADCRWLNGDVNCDGLVDFDDINPFVKCLVQSGCP